MSDRRVRAILSQETKLDLILEKIYDPIANPIKSVYYNIKYGIKNLIRFRKVIWNFRPWDQSYLLNIMEETFTQMAEGHDKGHLVKAPRSARELRVAANLCKRLSADDYLGRNHSDYFDQVKLDFQKMDGDDRFFEMVHIYKDPSKAADLERKSRVTFKLEGKIRKNDLDLLTKMMNRHLLSWWD